MGPTKGKRVKKTDVPTDTPTEFELGDTVADIQSRREEREAREREEEAQKQMEEARREDGMREETTHSFRRGDGRKTCKDRQK